MRISDWSSDVCSSDLKYYGIWTGGYEQPYAMYAPAIVPPPENSDTIESWEFFYEIAKRLGRQIVYHANSAGTGEHWDKLPIPFPLPLDRRPTTEEMFERSEGRRGGQECVSTCRYRLSQSP